MTTFRQDPISNIKASVLLFRCSSFGKINQWKAYCRSNLYCKCPSWWTFFDNAKGLHTEIWSGEHFISHTCAVTSLFAWYTLMSAGGLLARVWQRKYNSSPGSIFTSSPSTYFVWYLIGLCKSSLFTEYMSKLSIGSARNNNLAAFSEFTFRKCFAFVK